MAKRMSIVSARKQAGLTQKELAKKINKSFSSVQKYEMGLANPDLSTLAEIANVCNFNPAELVENFYSEVSGQSLMLENENMYLEYRKANKQAREEILQAGIDIEHLPPREEMPEDVQTLNEMMKSVGYSLGKIRGSYYLVGDSGGYALTDKQVKTLLGATKQHLKDLCRILESSLQITGIPRFDNDTPPQSGEGQEAKEGR